MDSARTIEVGCDWLTSTVSGEDRSADMGWLWESLLKEESYPRSLIRKGSFEGYMGHRIEHGFFGERQDGACVVLSGPLAARHARTFLELGTRPSRLDLQVTGEVGNQVWRAIENMFEQARGYKNPKSRPPSLKMWVGRNGPEGCYVGSRASETMCRFYDKGQESKQKAYQGHLRCEVELKRETARAYAGALLNAADEDDFIAGAVRAVYQSRGMTIPFSVGGTEVVLRRTTAPTTIESKAAWLMTQVAPTVRALAEEVGWGQVVGLLLPDSLDKQLGDGKIDAAAFVVGS